MDETDHLAWANFGHPSQPDEDRRCSKGMERVGGNTRFTIDFGLITGGDLSHFYTRELGPRSSRKTKLPVLARFNNRRESLIVVERKKGKEKRKKKQMELE